MKESFIVYNSQGNSKGMAIVSFHRKEDAMVARTKYNGKIIDGSESQHPSALFSWDTAGLFICTIDIRFQDVR